MVGVWYTFGALGGGLYIMWSCVSVFEGRKEASGLILSRDRVLRYDDWCRLNVDLHDTAHRDKKLHPVGRKVLQLNRLFIAVTCCNICAYAMLKQLLFPV